MKFAILPAVVLLLSLPCAARGETNGRCHLRVGQPRPAGCVPFKARATKAASVRLPRASVPQPRDADWVERLRAPKLRASQKRSQRLLIQELTRLERLLSRTKPNATDRSRIILRLAEGYAELELLASFEKRLAELAREREQRAGAKPSPTP